MSTNNLSAHTNNTPPINFTNLVEGQDYAAGEVIVKFKSSILSISQINALKESLGATVLETVPTLGIERWEIQGMSVEEAIAACIENPAIAYMEPNYIVSINTTIPNDPNYNQLWGLDNNGQTGGTPDADIDAPEAWDIQTGNNVLIGVIDTGVDYTHPDLINNIWTNPGEIAGNGIDDDGNGYVDDVHGYDFVNNDGDPYDDNLHGTHVSGTIAAEGNNGIGVTGVSWSAQIMGLKFLDSNGFGDIFDAVQALEYATLMGVQLTNNSWRGYFESQALYDAIAAAGAAGQLFIAAAGNESNNNDLNPANPASYDLDNIISVAATDHNDQLADFSNYGATTVDLGAPGVNVYSTLPGGGYGFLSGTSMAAPHVSGVVSLIWSQFPELTAQEVKDRILSYADSIPALQGITVSGGRLNAYNSLTETSPPPGEIHGSKWHDLDEDGQQDFDEPGLAGWTIYLDQNKNGQLDTGELSTITNGNGHYSFTGLGAGTYTVAEVLLPGWKQTFPDTGSSNQGRLFAVPADGSNDIVELNPLTGAEINRFSAPEPVSQGPDGLAFDGNSLFFINGFGSDQLWELNPNTGAVIDFDPIFAGSGDFDGLAVLGDKVYILDFGFSDIIEFDPLNDIVTNVLDIDAINPGVNIVGGLSGITNPNALLATDGFDTVFEIDSTTGIVSHSFSAGTGNFEAGVAVVDGEIYLGSLGSQTAINVLDRTGILQNTINLPYLVSGLGGDDIGGSSLLPGTHTVNLSPGEIVTNLNFGNHLIGSGTGTISGSKWHDLDEDGQRDVDEPGLAGWTIYLDQNQNGQLDSGETYVLTDINGDYSFINLNPGTYTVAELIPEGWKQTYPGFNGSFETGSFTSWQQTGEASIQTAAFGSGPTEGIYQALLTNGDSSVSDNQLETFLGLAFGTLDGLGNGNATQGSAIKQTVTVSAGTQLTFDWNFLTDEGISSPFNDFAFVSITSETTDTLANTFSPLFFSPTSFGDETGFATFSYTFTTDGTYTLGVGVVDVGDTVVDSGLLVDNFTFIGDAIATGSQTVTVGSGQIVSDIDFGNKALPVEIQGTKWNDLDGNGVQDPNEPGLAGWTIYLDQNQNGQFDAGETSTLTDINGNYTFENLNPGTYFVAEVQRPGWEQTFPGDGGGSETIIIDFESLKHDDANTVDHGFSYEEDGFVLDNLSQPFPFASFGTLESRFSGSTALFNNTISGVTRLTSPDGKPFDLVSIDLTELNGPNVANVTFTGELSGGGTVTQTFTLDGIAFDPETFFFSNFNDLIAVEWSQITPFHQFDNITITTNQGGIPGTHIVNVGLGDIVTDIDFGNKAIPPTIIYGTPNDDVLNITDSPVIVYALAGNDVVDGSQSPGANQFYGGKGNDTLIGNNYDQLFGQAGNDYLDVANGLGNNILFGGAGDDTLLGNVNDQLFGDAGNDTLDVSTGGGNNFLDGGKGNDTLFGNTNDQLFGDAGDDTLEVASGGGNNLLDGGNGDDILNALNSQGDNVLNGGKGDDVLVGNFNDQLNGGDGDDILDVSNGQGNNILNGGKGDDILSGSFNDQLDGGAGDDILNGGDGGSTMTGGTDEDLFWIANGFIPITAHTITDFEVDSEVIGIVGLGITFQNLTITQVGSDALISVFGTDFAILTGVEATDLDSSNFILA